MKKKDFRHSDPDAGVFARARRTSVLRREFTNTPLAIVPEYADFESGLRGDVENVEAFFDFLFDESPSPADDNGIRVIRVRGGLYRGHYYDDYEDIATAVEEAVEDPAILAVVIDADSPGGPVSGLRNCVDRVYAARGNTPIIAVANDMCASAMYAIASAADKVVASRTSEVGSIGTIAIHVDRSAQNAERGLKVTEVVSGERKNDLSPNKKLSKEGRSLLNDLVVEASEDFFEMVARNRNLSVDDIRSMNGALFPGLEAKDKGLVDEDGTIEDVVRGFVSSKVGATSPNASAPRAEIERVDMDPKDKKKNTGEPENGSGEGAEVISLDDARSREDAARTEADKSARDAVRAEAAEVRDLCAIAGAPELAADFIADGTSVADVRKALVDRKAAAGGPDIRGQHGGGANEDEREVEIDIDAIYARRRTEQCPMTGTGS